MAIACSKTYKLSEKSFRCRKKTPISLATSLMYASEQSRAASWVNTSKLEKANMPSVARDVHVDSVARSTARAWAQTNAPSVIAARPTSVLLQVGSHGQAQTASMSQLHSSPSKSQLHSSPSNSSLGSVGSGSLTRSNSSSYLWPGAGVPSACSPPAGWDRMPVGSWTLGTSKPP